MWLGGSCININICMYTLQNLTFVQPSVDEIVGGGGGDAPPGIKCGSEIAWYKKG